MRSSRLLSLVVFAVFTLIALCPALAQPAEEAQQVYVVVEFMQVNPGMTDAYLEIESEWKAIHQDRLSAGQILGWYLFAVDYPRSLDTPYQYVTVTLIDNLNALEEFDFPEIIERAQPGSNPGEFLQRTTDSRELIHRELWTVFDQTEVREGRPGPSRYAYVDLMKTKPGEGSEYIRLEREVFMPVHQLRVNEGAINAWGLYGLLLPGGTNYEYDFSTVHFFDSMANFEAFYPEGVEERAFPGQNYGELSEPILETRDLVRTELWQLIDYVE